MIVNKVRNLIYFLVVGWVLWILEKLREGSKAKQELLVDTYELRKKEIESGVEKESIDKLISDNNAKYKSGSGDGKAN